MLNGALDAVEADTKNRLDRFEETRFGPGHMRPPDVRFPSKAIPQNVRDALKGQSVGTHQLSDGSVWSVNTDGSITRATAPAK